MILDKDGEEHEFLKEERIGKNNSDRTDFKKISAGQRRSPKKEIMEAMEYSLLAGGKRLRPMLMRETYVLLWR